MSRKRKNIIRLGVLLICLAFIIGGLLREEHFMVLQKAASICLECIGVG
jgi:hypothetical protein